MREKFSSLTTFHVRDNRKNGLRLQRGARNVAKHCQRPYTMCTRDNVKEILKIFLLYCYTGTDCHQNLSQQLSTTLAHRKWRMPEDERSRVHLVYSEWWCRISLKHLMSWCWLQRIFRPPRILPQTRYTLRSSHFPHAPLFTCWTCCVEYVRSVLLHFVALNGSSFRHVYLICATCTGRSSIWNMSCISLTKSGWNAIKMSLCTNCSNEFCLTTFTLHLSK